MASPSDFADYVHSVINLDVLEKMTEDMDKDIVESQKLMDQIKCMFDTIPKQNTGPVDNGLRHEDLSNFLEAGVPKLLMDDMGGSSIEDVGLDDVIATMKGYAEDLKKNYTVMDPMATPTTSKEISNVDLNEYAYSLDQLGKRLANIKLSKPEEVNSRNPELEDKLTQLCQDVNNFTQMIQTKTKIMEGNKNWPDTKQDSGALQYNDVITKLLSGINEVTYLLQNRN